MSDVIPAWTAVTLQQLSRNQNLLNSIAEQEAPVTLYFPSVLKSGTRWLLLICFKTDENSIFDVRNPICIKAKT